MSNKPIALITGAAVRIGAAIAEQLAKRGYDLVLHYRSSEHPAQQLANHLQQTYNCEVTLIKGELDGNAQQLLAPVLQQLPRLDLVVNNASSFYPTPLQTATCDQFDDLFNSNAKGPFFVSKACATLLTDSKGQIINIADIWGLYAKPEHSIYCMAKAANIMLTKSLALELAPNVRVNGIAPGAILPPSVNGQVIADPATEAKVPLQKMGGEDVIVKALCSLLDNEYINAEVIKVDGGRTAQLG